MIVRGLGSNEVRAPLPGIIDRSAMHFEPWESPGAEAEAGPIAAQQRERTVRVDTIGIRVRGRWLTSGHDLQRRSRLQATRRSIDQARKCFPHRGTRENDRVHRVGKWLRFARSLVKFSREALKSLLLRALGRSPLFLCEENAFLLDCLIDRGELLPVAFAAEHFPSPERPSVMTVTAIDPEGHSFRRPVSNVGFQRRVDKI